MPRPVRAQGRPGTRVFPTDFEASHAVVVAKAATATVTIYAPAQVGASTMNADFSFTPTAAAEPLHNDVGARIQALNGQETAALVGDQQQITTAYLVVVDWDLEVPHNAIVQVTTCTDPSLLGDRRLIVRRNTRGSIRWERDLYCVDDQTRTGAGS